MKIAKRLLNATLGAWLLAGALGASVADKAVVVASISGTDEALVVRNGSGINTVADIKGKKLAAAPVSTDHYQLLALI